MYNLNNIKYENKRKCVSKDLRKDIYIYIDIGIDRWKEKERESICTYIQYVCVYVQIMYIAIIAKSN